MSIFRRKEQEAHVEDNVKENNSATLGERIAEGRKRCGYTQETFAELLDVTPQAVSKWENDVSCPDIQLLPKISQILGVTVDELLTGQKPPETDTPKAEKVIDTSKLKFIIRVEKPEQKPVVVSFPFTAAKRFAKMGNGIAGVMGNGTLSGEQLDEIINLVENGATGEVFKVESNDDTVVRFVIE